MQCLIVWQGWKNPTKTGFIQPSEKKHSLNWAKPSSLPTTWSSLSTSQEQLQKTAAAALWSEIASTVIKFCNLQPLNQYFQNLEYCKLNCATNSGSKKLQGL
jgi:hypothetical protein